MRQAKLCAFLLGALFLAAGARAAAGEAGYKPASRFYYSEKDFLNYETAGSGPAILVFLHGFGASLHVWDDVIKYLPKDRFTAYLLDLKGAGFSSRPRDGRYSIRDNADLVNKFIKANDLSGCTLVAHSFGGAVALFSAMDSLEDPALKPGKLVLIDPAAYPARLPGYIRTLRIPGLRNILYSLTTRVFQVRHILGKVIYDRSVITGELVRRYTAFMGQKNFAYALWKTADQMVPERPEQYTSRYKDLKYPALIIWGKEDRVLLLAAGERLAKDLPAAQLAVLAKCGHDAPEEFPEVTARLIETFAAQ